MRIEEVGRCFLIRRVYIGEQKMIILFSETTMEERARAAFRIHEVLFDNAQDIILYVNIKGEIVNANKAAILEYGYSKEELLKKNINDIRHKSTKRDFSEQMQKADAGGIIFESIHVRRDKSEFPVEVSVRSTKMDTGLLRIHIIRNITERKEQETHIAWLARYDGLTGVLNRRSLFEKIDGEILRSERDGGEFAVLLWDLDRFKVINDNYGHATGDLMLKEVTKRVQSILRQSDYLGRLGGDEFVIIARNITEQDDLTPLMERIFRVLQEPVFYNNEALQIKISVGVSLFPDDAKNSQELLHFADQAMYRIKQAGGNAFAFYSSLK